MNRASTTTQPPLAPAEAQALRDKTKQCAANLAKKAEEFRAYVTEFLLGGGPKALGIGEEAFRIPLGRWLWPEDTRERMTVS